MKLKLNLTTVTGLVLVAIVSFNNNVYSQGNSQGNANPNNNANTNAFKWETDGNNADSTDFIGTTNDSPLIIRTNNEERMRITEDGKVGISVLNPLERLELDGNLRLSGDVIFPSYASANDTLGRIITVDKDGKTQPKTHNELIDIIYQPIECPVFGYKPTWVNDVGKIYTAHLSGPNCQANVGIGTSEPESKLHVRGTTRSSRLHVGTPISGPTFSTYRATSKNDQQSIVQFGLTENNENYKYFDLKANGTLRMQNENREFFVVNADDEVVYAREVKVDQDSWPDYVFETDYELMPINELKTYINNHGRLPNIPSAEIVESEGLELGATAKITMEKVEELTLYTIEQQDQLDEQNKLIKNQQEQLDEQKSVIEAQQEVLKEQSELIEAQKIALEELMLKIGK